MGSMLIFKGFDVSFLKYIILFTSLLTCIGSNASTKVDVSFMGKTDLYYTDICFDKGVLYEGVFYNGLYRCSPKFNEYGGMPLIKNSGDRCDSEVFYDPASGKVLSLEIKYDEYLFNKLDLVLAEKYGKGLSKSEKTFTDPKLNVKHEWKDSKGGRILLGMSSESKVPEGRLLPVVVRYCAYLKIQTKEMNNSFNLWMNRKDEQYKNKLKSNASKL